MRGEMTEMGAQELRTPQAVDEVVKSSASASDVSALCIRMPC